MAKKEVNKKENSKNKKSFFKDFKAELKRVVWPTPKQLLNNTIAVVTIVLITAAIVFVLDVAFEALNKHGIDKVKQVIRTDNTVSENVTTENEETENTESGNENTEETSGDTNPEATDTNQNPEGEASQEQANTENNAQ